MHRLITRTIAVPGWVIVSGVLCLLIGALLMRRPAAPMPMAVSQMTMPAAALSPVSEVENIQDKLAPWPVSLAFYESRPIVKGRRRLHSVSLTNDPGFLIRLDVAQDDSTIAAVMLFGVQNDEPSRFRGFHLGRILGDEMIGDLKDRFRVQDAITDATSFAQRAFPVTIGSWTVSITESEFGMRDVAIMRGR